MTGKISCIIDTRKRFAGMGDAHKEEGSQLASLAYTCGDHAPLSSNDS